MYWCIIAAVLASKAYVDRQTRLGLAGEADAQRREGA